MQRNLTHSILAGACGLLFSTVLLAQSPDAKFVKEASAGGMAEVKLGNLAAQKGSSQAVKDFGNRMIADHTKAGDQLKSVASQTNMPVSTSITSQDQTLYNKLSSLSVLVFYKSYVPAMVKDHTDDIAAFQKEADSGKNDKIKKFASDTLPTLKEHLSMIQKIASDMGISGSTGDR
jgi:putative membrane protein